MKVPFYSAVTDFDKHGSEYELAISNCLNNGSFVLGEEVARFETEFADFCGSSYCISVGNGLDALSISLKAYGIGSGDEVLVPAHTFVATWLAVSNIGATPIPVDICQETYNIDINKVERVITSRTKAIIAVHLYGHPAEMEALQSICERRGLFLLEDAAQAHGASINGRRAGSLGHAAAFSFYPTKNLGAFGDGGAICTNDLGLAEKARLIRNYGSIQRYVHETEGINSRLDEIQASILRKKLPRLSEANSSRIEAAAIYSKILSSSNKITIPTVKNGFKHVYHLYVIQIDDRDSVQSKMLSDGISTLVHYPTPPYLQKAYKSRYEDKFEISTSVSKRVLSLPIFPGITSDQVEFVCSRLLTHINNP